MARPRRVYAAAVVSGGFDGVDATAGQPFRIGSLTCRPAAHAGGHV
jgi:hypothetical protein